MNKRRINARAVIWRDGKLLMVKHKKDDGTESPYWALPGGGVDPMELLDDAVKREVFEELGVVGEVGRLLCVQQFKSKRDGFREELEFFFHIKDVEGFSAVELEATSHGAAELARVKFVDPKKVQVAPQFLAEFDIEGCIAGKVPVYITGEL